MNALLVATLLAAGAGEAGDEKKPGAMPKVEGKWLIVYTEEGGRRNTAWERKVATVRGATLTYEREGEKRTIKLAFGPHQTLRATFSGGDKKGSYQGVYIAGRDYVCLSLNPAKGGERGAPAGPSS
jgi:hypothetical protein